MMKKMVKGKRWDEMAENGFEHGGGRWPMYVEEGRRECLVGFNLMGLGDL